MRISGFGPYALTSCVAAALVAGCGGEQQAIGASGVMRQTLSRAIAHHTTTGSSY